MFTRKTVASVLSAFTKAADELDAIADREADAVYAIDEQIKVLTDKRDDAIHECADAIATARRIRKLVEGE